MTGVTMQAVISLAALVSATPNGRLLQEGTACFTLNTMKAGSVQAIGRVFQSITLADGGRTLHVAIHQHLTDNSFSMRDELRLHRADLRPITLDNTRNGVASVHLDYTDHAATGWKVVHGARVPITVSFKEPVWDGNLWGITFAALPLRAGAEYALPIYQYGGTRSCSV